MEEKLDYLIKLTEENNVMLKLILTYLSNHTDTKDFVMNYIANLLSNKVGVN